MSCDSCKLVVAVVLLSELKVLNGPNNLLLLWCVPLLLTGAVDHGQDLREAPGEFDSLSLGSDCCGYRLGCTSARQHAHACVMGHCHTALLAAYAGRVLLVCCTSNTL